MDPNRRRQIEELFEQALDRSGAERASFLSAACGGDEALRSEVEALLAAHDRAEGVLETDGRAAAAGLAAGLVDEQREQRIGPYRVLSRLGRGGMGVVHLAERDDGQFRRRVAIKVLRTGAEDIHLYRRFLAERQILASLDHPNIAKLLDGGMTEEGLPYLVMEYVEGLPITDYCDRRRLGIDERLRLFQVVCAAVHYAHQNLVIHRDLKPSNILVAENGQVKLLDFGIAKLLNPTMSPMVVPHTRTEHRAMTPEYASPEQVRGDPITTASDVYSLGIVLYQLLAGYHPYRLARRSPDEVYRAVAEHEPERPSTRVGRAETVIDADGSTTRITPAGIGRARDVTPDRLRRRLRGDLDAITLVALRKEANRRYASVELLSQDIGSYLSGLPVAAHRGSRGYRVTKFVRRHRIQTLAAAIVTLSLITGAGAAFWQATLAGRERDRAEQARLESLQALDQSEAVTEFMIELFQASSPDEAQGDSITARELLRRGTERIAELSDAPLVQAALLEAVGRVQQNLGRYAEAEDMLGQALALREDVLGGDDPAVATTLSNLAYVLRLRADYERSIDLYRRALEIRRETLGATDSLTIATMVRLAGMLIYPGRMEESEATYREALRLQIENFGEMHPDVSGTLIELSSVRRRRGDLSEAETLLRRALEIRRRAYGPRDWRVADVMYALGDLLAVDLRAPDDAVALYRDGLEIQRQDPGESSTTYAANIGRFAGTLVDLGRSAEAVPVYERALVLSRRLFGPSHPSVLIMRSSYAAALQSIGDYDAAEREFQAAISGLRSVLGPEHAVLAGAMTGFGRFRLAQGRPAEADTILEEALRIRRKLIGTETVLIGITMADVAKAHWKMGDLAGADSLYRESLRIMALGMPDHHPDVRRINAAAAEFYKEWGKPDLAAEHRALASKRAPDGPGGS